MNEKIIEKLSKTHKSVYAVSKETGIPYTTMSEIVNQKTDINKAAAETVWKLSLYLGCDISDILNSIPLIENSSGKYRGVKYKWEPSRTKPNYVDLILSDNGEKTCFCTEGMSAPRFYKYFGDATEVLIDAYIKDRDLIKEVFDEPILSNAQE